MITTSDLLDLQGNEDTITPTALVELLRDHGFQLSRRTLSFWQSQGLVPPALRVGARGGVYPEAIVDLAVFVLDMRSRGLSIETTRELLPVWLCVVSAERDGCIEIAEIETVARRLDLSSEANYHVPSVLEYITVGLCENCRDSLTWVLKSGERIPQADGVTIKFALAEVSPADGIGDLVAWTQMTLPGIGEIPDPDDPALIVLGIPPGIELRRRGCDHAVAPRARVRRRACRSRTPSNQGVLQLTQ